MGFSSLSLSESEPELLVSFEDVAAPPPAARAPFCPAELKPKEKFPTGAASGATKPIVSRILAASSAFPGPEILSSGASFLTTSTLSFFLSFFFFSAGASSPAGLGTSSGRPAAFLAAAFSAFAAAFWSSVQRGFFRSLGWLGGVSSFVPPAGISFGAVPVAAGFVSSCSLRFLLFFSVFSKVKTGGGADVGSGSCMVS